MEDDEFCVVQVYYKHGEYHVQKCANREELIDYLENYIKEYAKKSSLPNTDDDGSLDDYIQELITIAKKVGKQVLSDEAGYAVVAVVKGKIM
jgi:poly-beta-hydroxyalkanoate depolymerase